MNFPVTIFVILLFATLTEASFRRHRFAKFHHPKHTNVLDNSNPSAGYIFMGEQSICSCRQNVVFLNFAKYLADNVIPYGCNGYGIRQFGDKAFNDTNLLQGYYSRDGMEWKANNWIQDDLDQICKYSDNVTYQSTLLNLLTLVQGKGAQAYQKNAVFLQGETDTIVDLDVSLAIARQIASYNAIIYIWDHSRYGDQTGLFSILTNNQPGRIIYSNASLVELINVSKWNLFSDFASIGCGNVSTTTPAPITEPSLPVVPGYCPNIGPKYTTTSSTPTTSTTTSTSTTTTTMRPTTTTSTTTTTTTSTQPPTTTTTTTRASTTTPSTLPPRPTTTTTNSYPISNKPCYKILFAGEMSGSITLEQKKTFFDVILQIAAHLPTERLQFGIATYGIKVFQTLNFQSYQDFVPTVNTLIEQLPYPNSSLTYVQQAYDEILNVAQNPNQKIAAFVMGQMEAVRDPNAGHTVALKIAATGTNVYVLDYSKGTIPMSIYPYLTNHRYDRIINGTGKSSNDLYNAFQSTLINDVINNHC